MILKLLVVVAAVLTGCEDENTPKVTFPELMADHITIAEADENITVDIPLELSKSYSQEVIVNFSTNDGSAVAGNDYKRQSSMITFQPGETIKTLNIEIIGDIYKEEEETFSVEFTSGINVSLATKEINITITDSDTEVETFTDFTREGYTTPTSYDGYTLAWQDEFSGATLSGDWTHEIGTGSNGWGNNELQYYRKENTSMVDGFLVITAKKESFGGRSYTSSRIITQGNQSFQYGRIDIRALLPQGQGIWPALWMLGDSFSTVGWPACGEIDIMEKIGGEGNENEVHGTLHWDNNGSHACTCEQGNQYTLSNGIFADEFHVFTIIWDANAIKWYVDDQLYKTVDITPAALSEFHQKFFFIFNVAVGGNWPGSPDNTTQFPQRMIVDYVRVFNKN